MGEEINYVVCPIGETGPNNLRNSGGSIIELKDRRLLMIYTHYYQSAHDCGGSDLRGKLSDDGGKSWSKPFLVQPNDARVNVQEASLLRFPQHRLDYFHEMMGLFYVKCEGEERYINYMRVSGDEGEHWSREFEIHPEPVQDANSWIMSGTATVLSSGRIILPLTVHIARMSLACTVYSDDGGMSWLRSHNSVAVKLPLIEYPVVFGGFAEPALEELRDGRLLMLGRTRLGRIYQSFSNDQGRTWSDAEPTMLTASESPQALRRIPDTTETKKAGRNGDLLLVWNQASQEEIQQGLGRMRLSCAISRDDGKTWEFRKNLESLDDTTYIEPFSLGAVRDELQETMLKIAKNALDSEKGLSQPKDKKRYYKAPGYLYASYPSISFCRDGRVILLYVVSDFGTIGLPVGIKVRILPLDWFYEA